MKDKPLELRVYSGLRRQAFTALAPLASVFWSSTRLGILDFLADLRVLGSEYSTFRPNFRVQSLGNRLSKSLEICCASCPDYGTLLIKISSDSDKWFPSYCCWKFELISHGIVNKVNKNCQYFRPNFQLQYLGFHLSESLEIHRGP